MSETKKTIETNCPRCGKGIVAPVLYCGEEKGDVMAGPSLLSKFCYCPGCKREFMVDTYFSLTRMAELSTVEKLAGLASSKTEFSQKFSFPSVFVREPEGSPAKVHEYYKEAVLALNNNLPNASGGMFRKCLEAATLDEEFAGDGKVVNAQSYKSKSLYHRLEELKKNGQIPPALHRLTDALRLEANFAVHDMDSFTIEEATALHEFTDAFLMQVFTIPKKIRSTRSNKDRTS